MERIIILVILSLGLTISCSRSVETEAELSFNLSKINKGPQANSVLAGYYPDLVLVNIKYDGKTHFQQWECPYSHDHSSGSVSDCSLPSSMVMNKTIPSGTNRLVQVLLVYSNEQDQMQFFYADKTVSFNGGSASVTVGDAGWTINTSGKEGRVAGRLTRGATNATDLTGTAIGYYQPSNGNPAMEVIKAPVFAGWFDFMFLEDVKFTYKMQGTNEVLVLGKRLQDFDISQTTITTNNLKMLKLKVPAHYGVWVENSNEYLLGSDILNVSSSTNVSTSSGLIKDILFDNLSTTYIYQTAPAAFSFNLVLNRFINITEVGLDYSNSPAGVSNTILGKDSANANISYSETVNTTGGTSSSSVNISGTYNATNQLELTLANNISYYEELIVKYNVYRSEYSSQRDNYLAFYDISTNGVASGGSGSVGWSTPGGTTYLQNSQLLALSDDPVDSDGAWLNKATDLAGDVNSLFVATTMTGSATNKIYIEKYSPNSCSAMTANCVPFKHQNENIRT
ncbi:MAG: hypothetical protein KDD37_03040, partial [Bdellovibrionales bacterium]|nr:hypothetical protein [Bdellovibrionales bacterium]